MWYTHRRKALRNEIGRHLVNHRAPYRCTLVLITGVILTDRAPCPMYMPCWALRERAILGSP